jgi:hypothetical protein
LIRIKSKIDCFRRCGVAHPAVETAYPDDRFSKEELAALKAEPVLLVEEIAGDPNGKGKGKKSDNE